jgi:hypothetical protein
MWRYADGRGVPFLMSYTYTFIVYAAPIAAFFWVKAPWYIALAVAGGVFLALSFVRAAYMGSQDVKMMREIGRGEESSKP